jgi:hypothetical protein
MGILASPLGVSAISAAVGRSWAPSRWAATDNGPNREEVEWKISSFSVRLAHGSG